MLFIEVDWEGNIVWEWTCQQAFQRTGLLGSSQKRTVPQSKQPSQPERRSCADWMHINSMSVLGPNHWYDEGDERFHPDNIIWDARESNIMGIISKRNRQDCLADWARLYRNAKSCARIGQIIGQHHCHMIPKGSARRRQHSQCFDNGGWAGYGLPDRMSKDGTKADIRDLLPRAWKSILLP